MTFTYTQFDAVADLIDERGVITTYEYDELNRPLRISYNNKNAAGVAATGEVTISYRTSSPAKGQAQEVVAGLWSEGYTYDLFGRVSGKTVVIRFRAGTDANVKGLGWYIDDITLNGDRVGCSP